MIYICDDCGKRFEDIEQTISEQKFGQCPGCLSENIKEKGGTLWIRKILRWLKSLKRLKLAPSI